MNQEFDETSKLHINRDSKGVARDLLHLEQPYVADAHTPLLAAGEYLERFGAKLGIDPNQLKRLSVSPEDDLSNAAVEYRFLEEKTQFDMTTVVFGQTYLGLPVWEAGVAVHIKQNPLRVVSAQSTLHPEIKVKRADARARRRLEKLNKTTLARQLGVSKGDKDYLFESLKIERSRLIIFQYKAAKRIPEPERRTENDSQTLTHKHLSLPLPPVAKVIEDGRHYIAAEVCFQLRPKHGSELYWRAIVEAETLSVLYLRAFADDVNGLVFQFDPVTTNGGPLPNATNAALNPLRTSVLLEGLNPPVGGNYSLTGNNVQLVDFEPPPAAPPTEPVGTDFNFNARSDNFAAVNAYHHCDRFFRLVESLGFDLKTYFGGTVFPTLVDHRGRYGTANGIEINARCYGNGSFGILNTAFCLADLGNLGQPLGLACDWRVVLHELGGHGILYNHVNAANFGFAHSAGDSFGAVLSDPESRASDRFQTFPWVYNIIGRRHDRSVTTGWAWGGVNDTGGYNSEQILCTTHFRIYRAIGGDSTEVAMREFAGRYVVYLILRAVGSLTSATNPSNAAGFATALMTAEQGDWLSEGQVGGAYWKVIRWAFEKQGLFQPLGAPSPVVSAGAPPPVDVYVDDGRHGEYGYGPAGQYPYLQKFWETTDIWNRLQPDGHPEHQTPLVGETNYAYVRVKNRGTLPASGVVVRGYHSRPSAGLVWPDDWKPMKIPAISLPGSIPSGSQVVAGPFDWKPKYRGHECMFVSVSAIGDLANNNPASFLGSALGPTPLWRMVPCDNNLALRAVIPVPGGGGRKELWKAFRRRRFWANNPFAKTVKIEVRVILPNFLLTRGWSTRLNNAGGTSFSLGPRAERVIEPRLIGGQTFSTADLVAAGYVGIEMVVLADGLVVGGLTFVLDPKLKRPARELRDETEEHEEGERDESAEEEDEQEKKEPRRIKLEIDVD